MSLEELIRRPVHALPPSADCATCAELMRDRDIGSVVVAEDNKPLGIVTDRDLVTRVMAAAKDPRATLLGDVMSRYPAFLSVERSLDEAVRTMRDLGVRRIPVVSAEGFLSGMLSLDDALMVIARQVGELGEAVRMELKPYGDWSRGPTVSVPR
jgi:CBS domain-containing protein